MNAEIFKFYIDAKKKHVEHAQTLGVLYTPESAADQIKLLDEIYDVFNLETVEDRHELHI
jgi:ABC-type uncharacterized transport system substrate-binding protein